MVQEGTPEEGRRGGATRQDRTWVCRPQATGDRLSACSTMQLHTDTPLRSDILLQDLNLLDNCSDNVQTYD